MADGELSEVPAQGLHLAVQGQHACMLNLPLSEDLQAGSRADIELGVNPRGRRNLENSRPV